MIDKEAAELRRRFRPDRTNIRKIYGCYVGTNGAPMAKFTQSLGLMPEDEQEKYLALLKKALSGSVGRTLNDISFTTAQVADSDEHRLLMRLRSTQLGDGQAVETLCEKIAKSLKFDTNYLILLGAEVYDVPFRSRDGEEQEDSGDTQFSYIVCAVCPVKETKPNLRYDAAEKIFCNQGAQYVVSAPETGFLFPAFDDRAANIYGALYYVRDSAASYDELVDAVFHIEKPPVAVKQQKAQFTDVLTESFAEECSAEVVQTVHTRLRDLVQLHKEAKDPEPLRVTPAQVNLVVENCGLSEKSKASFRVNYEKTFGADSAVPPQNLLDAKKLEYKLPDVIIKVAPDRQELIETRVIDGVEYVLIRADEGVEINGVPVKISCQCSVDSG